MKCLKCNSELIEMAGVYLPCTHCAADTIKFQPKESEQVKCTYCNDTGIDPFYPTYPIAVPCPCCKSTLKQ